MSMVSSLAEVVKSAELSVEVKDILEGVQSP